MQIRLAKRDDAPELAALFAIIYEDMQLPVLESVSHTDLVAALTTLYQHSTYLNGKIATTIVAVQDNQVVGTVFGHTAAQEAQVNDLLVAATAKAPGFKAPLSLGGESQGTEWYLSMIVVAPNRQGQGIGQKLLSALPQFIPHTLVGLNVARDNPAAERLYQRQGFRRTGELQLGGHPYYHLQKVFD